MEKNKNLYVVYCIDTEGPLDEPLDATFERLHQIFHIDMEPTKENLALLQNKKIDHPDQEEISKVLGKQLLSYNKNWDEVDSMLDKIMTEKYRNKFLDDEGNGLIYNWHCLDHVGFEINPRKRDLGYGKVFNHYINKIKEHNSKDKIHWHFHPIAFNKSAASSATSYHNSMFFLHQVILRRVIEHDWFPVVNRAGFHTIRQDSSFFLEQWIPFDYSNQREYQEEQIEQKDLNNGRFGDWRRAPKEWKPYHPNHDDYQSKGNMRRYTTKCLNIGTRLRLLSDLEIESAFKLALDEGKAILSFTNHDFRDMSFDIEDVFPRIFEISKKYSDVKIIHSDAVTAMQDYLYNNNEPNKNKIELDYHLDKQSSNDGLITLTINTKQGSVFGPQPYLAIRDKSGAYFHDNFDEIIPKKSWSYSFDSQTKLFSELETIKVAANDKFGNTQILTIK